MIAVPEAVSIRRAGKRDVVSLLILLREYFAEGHVQQDEDEQSLLPQVQATTLGFYIAETETRLAGCMLCRPLQGRKAAAEGKRMYVRPQFRGYGIARRLMDTIEAEARAAGFDWMYLDSKDNFDVAIAMYKRRGYMECARFNDNREATLFFRKPLH